MSKKKEISNLGGKNMVRREIMVPQEDWEYLMEYFRTKGYIPRPKIAEIFTIFVRDLKRKALDEKKKELSKLEEELHSESETEEK